MNSKKIALVSDWFAPRVGGVERHMIDLAAGLSRRGHLVEIVTATPGDATLPELPGVRIHRLDVPRLPGWSTVYRPRDGARLVPFFADRGYDLVHAHSIYSPLALAAAWAGHELRLPTVLTAHSMVRHAGTLAFRALDYALLWSSWPSVLTAVSDAVAADLRRASFAEEVHVLPNGLFLPPPVQRPFSRGPLTVVSVMRLMPRKRPAALVTAFAELCTRLGSSRPARLVILGGGPLEESLRALAKKLGIADRVEMRGWATSEEVRAALATADVFALPTRKEAFGLAALEASAASLPVVTMRGSGAADLFTPNVDGAVAASDAELASELHRLAIDEPLRRRLGAQARVLAERYAWEPALDRTEALYEVAAKRCRTRPELPVPAAPTLRIVPGVS